MHHHLHLICLYHSIALHQSELYKIRLSSQSYPLCEHARQHCLLWHAVFSWITWARSQ